MPDIKIWRLILFELRKCSQQSEMAAKGAQILNTRDELNELVRRRAELAVRKSLLVTN